MEPEIWDELAEKRMPFGKYKGQKFQDISATYLFWLCRDCRLSHGMRHLIAGELLFRGIIPPPAPEPKVVPVCQKCGMEALDIHWQTDRNGNRRIRADCMGCGRFLTWLPQ